MRYRSRSEMRAIHAKRGNPERSMFFEPAQSARLAAIIRISSPEEARRSVAKLRALGVGPHTRRAMTLAANRAQATTLRRNITPKTRREMAEVARIYREAARWGRA